MADLRPIDVVDEATLKTALKQREDRLAAIQKRVRPQPMRYVVTLDLPNLALTVGSRFPVANGSQVVKSGTVFRAETMEATYSVVGTTLAGLAATVTLAPAERELLIKGRFKVRDSGSDREWQNDWIPLEVLLSGNENPLRFGNGRGMVSGGSNLIVDVDAMFTATAGGFTALGLSAVSRHVLKFSFWGKEVVA